MNDFERKSEQHCRIYRLPAYMWGSFGCFIASAVKPMMWAALQLESMAVTFKPGQSPIYSVACVYSCMFLACMLSLGLQAACDFHRHAA